MLYGAYEVVLLGGQWKRILLLRYRDEFANQFSRWRVLIIHIKLYIQ